ncbi:transposase [Streptomyces sp. SID4951]|nr:transposase [Streptomyces sp. SID4951]
MIADKAYSSRGFRGYLRRHGIAHTVPEKTDQRRHHRGRRGGRPPGFNREVQRRRNLVMLLPTADYLRFRNELPHRVLPAGPRRIVLDGDRKVGNMGPRRRE